MGIRRYPVAVVGLRRSRQRHKRGCRMNIRIGSDSRGEAGVLGDR